MAYAYPEIKQLKGLYKQGNSFTVPDGALEEATNLTIKNDNILSSRRGFHQYFEVSSGTLNNLFNYQDTLLAMYNDKLSSYADTGSSPNETGSETAITGETILNSNNRISRSLQANSNLYMTTDNGIIKMTSASSTTYKTGAPQGLDVGLKYATGSLSTFFPIISSADAIVGYRVVFGYRDANDNLILSAPSQIASIENNIVTGSAWTRTSNVVTVTTTASHLLNTGDYIQVENSSGAVTDEVDAGSYQITVTAATTYTFSHSGADEGAGPTLDYSMAMPVRLEVSIPSEITTDLTWFYQIYRSSQQLATVGLFSDFKLITEEELTSGEISAGLAYFNDDIDDILLGAELYTNENSREGELQANFRPPLCDDVTYFKGHAIYAKATTRHLIDLAVIDTTALTATDYVRIMTQTAQAGTVADDGSGNIEVTDTAHGLADGDLIYIDSVTGTLSSGLYYVINKAANTYEISTSKGGGNVSYTDETALNWRSVQTYVSQSGVANRTVGMELSSSSGILFTYVSHGFADEDQIYISQVTGTLSTGTYYVRDKTANTFRVETSVGNGAEAWTDETYAEVQGVAEAATDYPMFYLSADTSASVRLRDTAEALVKAINRDSASLVYAEYTSGIDDIPGKFRLQAKGFDGPINLLTTDAAATLAFSPTFPTAFSTGTQVISKNEDLPHTFYASKEGEPEAVPLVNRFPVGSKNATLLRSLALRDSIILLKEDGVWRVTGDNPSNFTATLLDGTVVCLAENSVDVINNQVAFLSNQGVCFVTESTVQILSREGIEDPLQPILGQTALATETAGVAYESERLYLLTTTEPNTTTASITYAYNILTQEWTTWDRLLAGGVVGPKDKLFYIHKDDNDIMRERKNQNRTDYADQNHSTTIDAISSLTITLTCTTTAPQQGDMLIKNNVITHIDSVPELVSGNQYTFTVLAVNNLAAADTPTLYERYERKIKLAPFHAGLVGRLKFFAQMSVHMRDNSMSKATITFTGQTYGGSTEITWTSQTISAGWGNFPWGFEPWGQETGIELTTGTQPAPVMRIYVPPFQARNTYIQPIISHIQAGEPTNIQAFSFAVRPYGERLSI